MKVLKIITLSLAVALGLASCAPKAPSQYFFLNDYNFNYNYERIGEIFGRQAGKDPAIGQAILIYIFERPMEWFEPMLKQHFEMAERYDIPVLVELDPITFWDSVPELWNWFDPSLPGYKESNRENVEWYDWGSENAIKIGWLNWGAQIRLRPMANLYSPEYQAAVKDRMGRFLDMTWEWYDSLPRNKKYLLGGIKITGELGFGVNNWYYPDGNELYDKPKAEDPQYGLSHEVADMPFRGVGPMGYASLTYSGIRTEGEITPEDIYRLEWEYSKFIADICQGHGFPREMLFSHSGGWGDDLAAPVQANTCPSWSFYWHEAMNPVETPQYQYLQTSDAPYWGLSEWNIGYQEYDKWAEALENCFSLPGCRFISVFNRGSVIRDDGSEVEGAVKALIDYQNK